MKLQSLNNGYAIRTLSPKPNYSTKLKLPATVQSCAPEQDLRGQSIAIVGLEKSVRVVAMLALAKDASAFAFDQNPNLRLLEIDMETKIASFEVPALGVYSQLQLGAMKTMGGHNFHIAAVAALFVVGLNVGVDVEAIGPCIEKLRAPPHRMQIVCKDIHGVTWVDDSKATNVEATYARLMGLKKQKYVVLLGGLTKFGSSGMLIQKTLSDNGLSIPCIRSVNLKDAVNWARRMAEHGDNIVLSPGCASFDEFRNFEHR